jgi:hypothetical protein
MSHALPLVSIRVGSVLVGLLLLALVRPLSAQDLNIPRQPTKELEAVQKKLMEVQGHGSSQQAPQSTGSSLKRRDMKGQALSSEEPAQQGLTPEQQKMYQELQQQLQQIQGNIKKRDEALEQLDRSEGYGR